MTRKTFLQFRLRHFTRSFGTIARAFVAAAFISAPLFAQADPYPSTQPQEWQQQNPQQQDPQLENLPREPTQSPSGGQLEYCAEAQNAGLPECRANFAAPVPGQVRRPARSPSQQEAEYKASEPPTEFQRYILTSSGERLPIYGAWLFEHVPSTFAPLDQVPVKSDYTLGPGDQIDVRAWGQINFNQPLTLDRSGDVFLPQVGRISLAGLNFAQVQGAVRSAIGRVYKNFDINVGMGRLRSIEVFIVGQARRPGSYTVSSLSTLVNALFASGGPSSRGSMRRIELRRCDKVITTFDLYDLIMRGDKSKDVPLQAGDVIFIPRAGPRVAVTGTVDIPAIYEITANTPLGDVLADAGGLSSVAAGKRAILERVDQHAALHSDDIALTPQGLATVLQDGDIIRLLSLVPRFENTITLRGNVADPVRLPWHDGMRVSDVIPDKSVLLTRGYWTERNRLRDEKQEKTELADLQMQNRTFEMPNLTTREQPLLASLDSSDVTLGRARSSDYQAEQRNTAADKSLAASFSNQETPPVRYFSLKNDVQPAAPDIDWSFASIERIDNQNLTTRLISFNLGKAVVDHDAASNVLLQPGDIITIFSRADIATPRSEQSKLVRLEGEVNMAGVYSVEPGETLHQLLARAGGLSPNAYLYGAQFTRESTRREQQKRYNDFLDQLDRDISQSASTVAGRIVPADQGPTIQAAIASQHSLVDRLRQTPVSGRIVFDLEPGSKGIDALPDISLENGDRLYVPYVPSTVNVVGTVYNQSSFVFASDFRLIDYLRDAGGATPLADKNHIFVIRANGSIIARETRPGGPFTGSFDSLRMYPGDTVVVPTNVTKTTKLRGLLDLSQVLSGFGLAAAAVNVLK